MKQVSETPQVRQLREKIAKLQAREMRLLKRNETEGRSGGIELSRVQRKLAYARAWLHALEYSLDEADASAAAVDAVLHEAARELKERRPGARVMNAWLSPAHFANWSSGRSSNAFRAHGLQVKVWKGREQGIDEVLVSGADRYLALRMYLPAAGVPHDPAALALYQKLRAAGVNAFDASLAVSETLTLTA